MKMATRKTSAGATVTTTSAKSSKKATKVAATEVQALPPLTDTYSMLVRAQVAQDNADAVVAPAAPVPAVALRGGPAVASVLMTGKIYRTKAQHNMDWWNVITSAAHTDAATVAALIEAKVPSHFIGYCIRRGYLQAA